MLIEEMMDKRDFATSICVALQNQIGKDIAGVFEMDDFEKRSTESFEEYVNSEMERLHIKVMIFTGWAFTKEVFEKQYNYYLECNDSDRYVLYSPELNTLIVADSKDTYINDVVKKIDLEVKKGSDLNIKSIEESNNGIQINYFTNTFVKYFDERPKSVEEIIRAQKE